MKYLTLIVHSMLLFTVPCMAAYPQNDPAHVEFQLVNYDYPQDGEEWTCPTTYDGIMQMLADLESGELERRYSPNQLQKVSDYLAILAKEGILPDELEEEVSVQEDIYDLLYGEDSPFQLASYLGENNQYMIIPAVMGGYSNYDIVQCGKISKAWKKTKKFVKKHKKAIIIGAVVVVAVAAVAVAVVAASSAAAVGTTGAAAGGATGGGGTAAGVAGTTAAAAAAGLVAESNKPESVDKSSSIPNPSQAFSTDIPIFRSAMEEQISSFKESMARENFFQTFPNDQRLSLEETGRIAGPIFAHDSFNQFHNYLSTYPQFAQEIQEISARSNSSLPLNARENPIIFGHTEIDNRFSSNCGPLFSNPAQEVNLNSLPYKMRGEAAHFFGHHTQAVNDFSKAIDRDPTDPMLYLQRSSSYFNLGQYDRSLEDFHKFTTHTPPTPQNTEFSISDFTRGFAKGLTKGILESGKQNLLFLGDCITQPIHTANQIYEACCLLADYVHKKEWGMLAEALSPEARQLVTEWNTLSAEEKGHLTGFALGKNGSDFATPGVVAKLINKGIKGAQEVAHALKNIKMAEQMLPLEAAAEIGNGAKVADMVHRGQTMAFLGEELGFSPQEIGQLKQAGKLETTLQKEFNYLSLSKQESIALYKKAQHSLKPHTKKPMSEIKIRELIHETGIPTFSRPEGIPKDFLVMISDKGVGMKYVHPQDTGTYVRVMPGKPYSPFPYQQKPYVNQRIHGKSLDKHGNLILNDSPKAHIPLEEFVYKDIK